MQINVVYIEVKEYKSDISGLIFSDMYTELWVLAGKMCNLLEENVLNLQGI